MLPPQLDGRLWWWCVHVTCRLKTTSKLKTYECNFLAPSMDAALARGHNFAVAKDEELVSVRIDPVPTSVEGKKQEPLALPAPQPTYAEQKAAREKAATACSAFVRSDVKVDIRLYVQSKEATT